jgi:glycosyltransferase involved in cell wall biosynthesis
MNFAMKPRILYPFAGDRIGGGPLSTLEIARGIGPEFETVIALHRLDGALGAYLQNENIRFESAAHIQFPPSPLNLMGAIIAAKNFLKKHGITIIQADDGPPRYIWFYAAKMAGVKYVLTQRTLLKRTFEKNISYRFIDSIVVNSEATRRSLPRLPSKAPVFTAPAVVKFRYDLNQRPELRRGLLDEINAAPDTKIIGFVSQMHPRKRPDLFIRIAAHIKKHAAFPVKFVMAGAFYDGIERKIYDTIAHENLKNDVHILGYRDDPQALIAALDALIAPATDEAFGRTLVEAMGLGTPVIAFDGGGHREIIRNNETGFLIASDKPEIFAQKTIEIISDLSLNKVITDKAFNDVKTRFAPEAAINIFKDIYKNLS